VRKADVQVVRAQHQKAGRGQVGDHLVHHHQDSAPSRDRIEPVAANGAEEIQKLVTKSQIDFFARRQN
jgi:hypothetical protein